MRVKLYIDDLPVPYSYSTPHPPLLTADDMLRKYPSIRIMVLGVPLRPPLASSLSAKNSEILQVLWINGLDNRHVHPMHLSREPACITIDTTDTAH